MDTILNAVPWQVVTPLGALIIILVWLIRTVVNGAFVPQATHEREIALIKTALDNEKANTQSWKEAHTVSEVARNEQGKQLGVLLDTTQALHDVLAALPVKQSAGEG